MKILVFGPTGTVGKEMVRQALAQGHRVTAFARDPAKIGITSPALSTAEGDVMNPPAVDRAMAGHDAVIVALGAGAKGLVRARGTANIAAAMRRHKIHRLVCLSSLGVGDSRRNLNAFWKHFMFGLLLRKAYADHVAQEKVVNASDLDWTIVRPAAYTNGPLTERYRHGFAPSERNLQLKISRADVAHFVLRQLRGDQYLRASPGLSY